MTKEEDGPTVKGTISSSSSDDVRMRREGEEKRNHDDTSAVCSSFPKRSSDEISSDDETSYPSILFLLPSLHASARAPTNRPRDRAPRRERAQQRRVREPRDRELHQLPRAAARVDEVAPRAERGRGAEVEPSLLEAVQQVALANVLVHVRRPRRERLRAARKARVAITMTPLSGEARGSFHAPSRRYACDSTIPISDASRRYACAREASSRSVPLPAPFDRPPPAAGAALG